LKERKITCLSCCQLQGRGAADDPGNGCRPRGRPGRAGGRGRTDLWAGQKQRFLSPVLPLQEDPSPCTLLLAPSFSTVTHSSAISFAPFPWHPLLGSYTFTPFPGHPFLGSHSLTPFPWQPLLGALSWLPLAWQPFLGAHSLVPLCLAAIP
jgi:hypothetical protein